MAKRTTTKATDLESRLTELVDRAAPGDVTIRQSTVTYAGRPGYEVYIASRHVTDSWTSDTIADAVDAAADEFTTSRENPTRPAWRRLTQHQRELVRRTLEELTAKHMAYAAAAKIAGNAHVLAEFEIADAFHAAATELQPFDEEDGAAPDGKLETEPIHITRRRTKRPARAAE